MAFIVNINSNLHSLYTYTGTPIIDPTNYANNVQVGVSGLNPNLYINDPSYGFTFSVNFSGISLRGRGAPTYGFDTFAGQPGVNSSGVKIVNNNVYYPTSVDENFWRGHMFNGGYATNLSIQCYYPGCPSGNFTIASDFNYWNNGIPSFILISPKHLICTKHFIPYPTSGTFYFLGTNEVIYSKTATTVIDFNNRSTYPANYNWPNNFGKDWALLELDQAFTTQELQYVKPYKFLNNYGIPNDVPLFRLTPQGIVVVTKNHNSPVHYFDPNIKPNAAYQGLITNTQQIIRDPNVGIWKGDSGTPLLCYVPHLSETCFVALLYGGGGIQDSLWSNPYFIEKERQFFDALKEYIFDVSGYEISLVNYLDPPPYTETIYQNGETYTLYNTTISENSNLVGNTTFNISGLLNGATYSYIVVSYNNNGYSAALAPNSISFQVDPNHHPLVIIYGDENAVGLAKNYQALQSELGIKSNIQIFNNDLGVFESLNIGSTGNNILGIPGVTNVTDKFWEFEGQTGPPHGIELGIAKTKEMVNLFGNKDIYIIKIGERGLTSGSAKLEGPSRPLTRLYNTFDIAYEDMISKFGRSAQVYIFISIGVNDAIEGVDDGTFRVNIGSLIEKLDYLNGRSTVRIFTLLNDGGDQTSYGENISLYNTVLQEITSFYRNPDIDIAPRPTYWIKTSDAQLENNDIYHWGYTGMKLIAERFITFASNTWGYDNSYGNNDNWPPQPTY